MQRRDFHRVCGSLVAAAIARPAAAAGTLQADTAAPAPRSTLVDEYGTPLLASDVPVGQALIFHYPYVTTPCFLLRLSAEQSDQADQADSDNALNDLRAFSAICSHKMSHPARPISHIAYRADPVTFYDSQGNDRQQTQVISCCSERSVYDARQGGAVLAGPAPVPLAQIALALGDDGSVQATGSAGPDQYERFLEAFGFRLAMEHGITDVRARAGATTTAVFADQYSRQQVRC